MKGRVLIIDDEQPIRESLKGLFEDEGYLTDFAASGEEAVARFRKQPADCVFLDIWLPGIDGLETLSRLKRLDGDLPVVMMSGHASIDTAVRATRMGAFDFVEKPFSSDKLLILIHNALEKRQLHQENVALKQDMERTARFDLLGKSRAITEVRALIERVAPSDAPVLITAEHGAGKEVAARYLHRHSARADHPFIDVKSASIPDARMDSELFGHEKGAFPGALHMQRGRFELADGGSLFFDEVTDLSQSTQARILRVLQEGSVQRLGSPMPINLNVRLLTASSGNLEQAIRQGILREDFYYRLNVVAIHLPSLRERIEDLPVLASFFAGEVAKQLGGEAVRFTADAVARMQAYPWPGNVRELRNYVERSHILKAGQELGADEMLALDQAGDVGIKGFVLSFHSAREAFERSYLIQHLHKHAWNISRTAEEIGMERSQLHRKIKRYGLAPSKE
ncbi:MAG: sigma-54 dependent transcriptional regulator [Mariprofundaceae bacterium]